MLMYGFLQDVPRVTEKAVTHTCVSWGTAHTHTHTGVLVFDRLRVHLHPAATVAWAQRPYLSERAHCV